MYWRQVVSQSPLSADVSNEVISNYLDAWEPLHKKIRSGSSFSGRERHCAFLNTGNGSFEDVSAASGLNLIDDGRSIAVTDWDQDGDLDLWITNRNAPRIRFLRNDRQSGNDYISIQLKGDPKLRCPRDAYGARVGIIFEDLNGHFSKRVQTLHGGDSFLSQSSKSLHFGVRKGETIKKITVRWPGSSEVEEFQGGEIGARLLLCQGKSIALKLEKTSIQQKLDSSNFQGPEVKLTGRLKMVWPQKISGLTFDSLEAIRLNRGTPLKKPILLILWASWCPSCLEELKALSKQTDDRVELIALNVELEPNGPTCAELNKYLDSINFPGIRGVANSKLISELNQKHLNATSVSADLPLPASFLIDTSGELRVVYKGIFNVDQMLKDVTNLGVGGLDSMKLALPFPGKWSEEVMNGNPAEVGKVHIQNGNIDDAEAFLNWYLKNFDEPKENINDDSAIYQRSTFSSVHYELGRVFALKKKNEESFGHFKKAFELNPDSTESVLAVISHLIARGDFKAAVKYVKPILNLAGGHPRVEFQLGMIAAGTNNTAAAIKHYRTAFEASQGRFYPAANNLAWILATSKEQQFRNGAEAVNVAIAACEATGHKDYRLFSTLGAAYAEVGEFSKAIEAIQRGISMAEAKPDPQTVSDLKALLEDFRAGRAHRD